LKSKAACIVLTGEPMAANAFGKDPQVLPKVSEIEVSKNFKYEIPPYSLTVIRIKK